MKDALYFESHITIDPVGDRLGEFTALCESFGFRPAKLLMDKGVPSQLDTFCTGHATEYKTLEDRMVCLLYRLRDRGFGLRRYKIESVVLDSRKSSELFDLGGNRKRDG